MKHLIFCLTLIFTTFYGFSQDFKVEKVDWNALKSYTADDIEFVSTTVQMKCSNCQFVEIVTESGLTGIFLMGKGKISVKIGDITDSISGCLIRMNPKMTDNIIVINNRMVSNDKGFVAIAKNILNDSFGHCYQSNLNALIPDLNDFALNFFGYNYGEVLASISTAESVVFSFSERKMLAKSPNEGSKE